MGSLSLILLFCVAIVGGFTAYDCEHNEASIVKVDGGDVAPCPTTSIDYLPPKKINMQVIQVDTRYPVKAYQCKATVTQIVTRCGFNSLTYGSETVVDGKLFALHQQTCNKAVETGKLRMNYKTFPIEVNSAGHYSFYSHGRVDPNGYCDVENFKNDFNHKYYEKSYEQTIIDFSLEVLTGILNLATGEVKFLDKIIGNFSSGSLVDPIEGTIVWNNATPGCNDTASELFRGMSEVRQKN